MKKILFNFIFLFSLLTIYPNENTHYHNRLAGGTPSYYLDKILILNPNTIEVWLHCGGGAI